MKIQHIYWFAYFSIDEPSVRYRGKYALNLWQAQYGISSSFVYPSYKWRNILHFLRVYFEALCWRKKDSIIVFENIYTHRIYTFALKLLLFWQKKHSLYDIDDADYTRFPPDVIHHFMRNCEACSVGSQGILEYTKAFNSQVFLLTSPVIAHNFVKGKRNSLFTIGWIGYYSAHKESLKTLFFPALLDIDFPVKLVLLGVAERYRNEVITFFSANKNIFLEMPKNIDWLAETAIYAQIQQFDVGISPLLKTEFNIAKSAFKQKQCLSCGVPVLATPLGENIRFLEAGKNGYFCENPADFQTGILRLKNMTEEEYQLLSQHARKSFETFSMAHYCETLIDFYKKIE